MCYNNINYGSDLKSATLEVRCRKDNSVSSLEYKFNDGEYQSNNQIKVDSSMMDDMKVSIRADN